MKPFSSKAGIFNLNFFPNSSLRKPKSVFLQSGDIKITYQEFEDKVEFFANLLKEKGIKEKDNVVIISENNIDFVYVVFALWILGAVPIPINIRLTNSDIKELISFSDSKFILTGQKLSSTIKLPNHNVITFPIKARRLSFSDCVKTKINLNDTALMIFTSGSTGKPKAVMLSFNSIIKSALTGNQFLKINSGDKLLASLPFYHIGGFSILIRAFLFGAKVIIPKSLKIDDLIFSIERQKPTHASLVSTQLKELIVKNITPVKKLKNILLGGGFISEKLIKTALKKGWRISKSYGSTETSSFVAAMNYKELKINPKASGKSLSPNKILIVDKNHKTLNKNEVGEICIKSPALMKGYFKNKRETERKLTENLFFSGDIGYLNENGFLIVEARRNNLIISGGENINPFEVESKVLNYPGIIEAFVFGLDDHKWGQTVSAAIVLKGNKKLTVEKLKMFLKNNLADYKMPRKIFQLKELPKNSLGKIQKEKIKQMFS